jgi:hypothetical protein
VRAFSENVTKISSHSRWHHARAVAHLGAFQNVFRNFTPRLPEKNDEGNRVKHGVQQRHTQCFRSGKRCAAHNMFTKFDLAKIGVELT